MRRLVLWTLAAVCSGLPGALAQVDVPGQIEQVSALLKTKPYDALLWYKRGELYRAHHEPAHALADYAQAELLDPGLELVYLSRGRAFYESARFSDAYRALSQFLQMVPDHADALLFRARTRIQLGQRHAAELDFAQALLHSKDASPEPFLERASNLSQVGKAGAALVVLDEAIARFGPLPSLDDAALAIELHAKRWPQALRRVDAMLSRSERKEHLLARKAQILDAVDDKAAAREVRQAALLQIAGLPESERKLASTQKLAHALESELGRAQTVRRK